MEIVVTWGKIYIKFKTRRRLYYGLVSQMQNFQITNFQKNIVNPYKNRDIYERHQDLCRFTRLNI